MLRHVSSVKPDAIAPPGPEALNAIRKTIAVGMAKNSVSHRKLGAVRPIS
jgi:hypothetical protein